MSLTFTLASGNKHKAKEFNELFSTGQIQINPAPEVIEVVEDGDSYAQNAFLKAQAYFKKYQLPVLADDSGLNVEALPGELGIHSARFGGLGLTDSQRVELLLEKMKDVSKDQRLASFTCMLCFYLSDQEVFFFEGRLKGEIALSPSGQDGFGYDPVFIPESLEKDGEIRSIAQAKEWKKTNSHRAIAAREAQLFFKERRGQI